MAVSTLNTINITEILQSLAKDLSGKNATEQANLLKEKYGTFVHPRFSGNRALIALEVTSEFLLKATHYKQALLKNLITWLHTQARNGEIITADTIKKASGKHLLFFNRTLSSQGIPPEWTSLLRTQLMKNTQSLPQHLQKR